LKRKLKNIFFEEQLGKLRLFKNKKPGLLKPWFFCSVLYVLSAF